MLAARLNDGRDPSASFPFVFGTTVLGKKVAHWERKHYFQSIG
jgi:hypothetical protein